MAKIVRYGAYVPKYRAALGEIQSFEGRPGRPRSKYLAIPALDEDPAAVRDVPHRAEASPLDVGAHRAPPEPVPSRAATLVEGGHRGVS